jgi:hypothetical protein
MAERRRNESGTAGPPATRPACIARSRPGQDGGPGSSPAGRAGPWDTPRNGLCELRAFHRPGGPGRWGGRVNRLVRRVRLRGGLGPGACRSVVADADLRTQSDPTSRLTLIASALRSDDTHGTSLDVTCCRN